MIQYHVYPGGKKRIVTFSYDDGSAFDERLVGLFNKYGVKSTFHLNGINYENISQEEKERLCKLYEGHEVACHTLQHGWPSRMPLQSVITETFEDRKILEKIFGYPVTGMSYPSGSYDAKSIEAMKSCGIVYSRTVKSTMRHVLPEDFMEWHPTCHHKNALELCDKFLENIDSIWAEPLFYIWGHSHDIKDEAGWQYMEEILKKLSGNDKIWYATNIEIFNYMEAQKRLVISADETMFYNPSSITVWVEKDRKEIIEIPAGQMIVR